MRLNRVRVVLLCALAVGMMSSVASDAHAQAVATERLEDVVYLKDGGIVRGVIVEQVPGQSVLIRTRDGNQFRYQMDQIARMTREAASNAPMSVAPFVRKSPVAAGALSALIIGGGQAYNGEWGKAAGFLGGAIVFGSATLSELESDACVFNDECGAAGTYALLWLGNGVWSILDAVHGAKRINREHGVARAIEFGPRLPRDMVAGSRAESGRPLGPVRNVRGPSARVVLLRVTW